MNNSPQVSVIIPIYNSEQFLDKCIEGVLNQSFSDFELILIDDGSKDKSWDICCKWSNLDKRIKSFRQDNAGASAARNHGLKVAKGNWILFIDSDDSVLPNYISNLINSIRSEDIIVLAISGIQVYRNGVPAEKRDFPNVACNVSDYKKIFGDIRLHKYGFSVGKLYNRDIIEQAHLRFDEKICIAEDCIFMLHYLMHCSETLEAKISFIDQCDYLYYIHQNSLSTDTSTVERELYSYNKYRETIYEVKKVLNIDNTTFNYMHSPIVFYADRVINSVYKNLNTLSSRKRALNQIDRIEYKKYKKASSLIEMVLCSFFVQGPFWAYDIIRRNI